MTCPLDSSQDATAVGLHAPFAFTHAHVGLVWHAGGSASHEYESGGVPPSGSAMPGAWSTQYREPELHVVDGPHAKGPPPPPLSVRQAQPTLAFVQAPFWQIHA